MNYLERCRPRSSARAAEATLARAGEHARAFLGDWRGSLICDDYTGYKASFALGVTEAGCMAHAKSGETILVVEDEPDIRQVLVELLEDAGYIVISAADGVSATRTLQSCVRIDLLLSDIGLPGGMNGRQLADSARV